MDELIQDISSALAYEGFDPVKLRETALETLSATELVTFLAAYIAAGNNLTGRVATGKVGDKGRAEAVLKLMKNRGVVTKASSSTDITLPRLAASFPALLIGIRWRTAEAKRVDTSTPWHLQDAALNGYVNTVAAAGCEDFVKKFALTLAAAADKKAGAKTNRSEEEVLRPLLELRAVAKANQSRDPLIHLMDKPVDKEVSIESLLEAYGVVVSTDKTGGMTPESAPGSDSAADGAKKDKKKKSGAGGS